MLVVRILPLTRFFCNVHLFRVPRSRTGSVQMISSMTFIRGKRCIENDKDNYKSREVKRLKECTLALNITVICRDVHASVYDKNGDLEFPIVNFPWLSGDVPRLRSYGVYISQLVRFDRCRISASDFHSKNL